MEAGYAVAPAATLRPIGGRKDGARPAPSSAADEAARDSTAASSLSRSNSKPAQAPPAYRGAPYAADCPASGAGLAVRITGCARAGQAGQDTVGSDSETAVTCD